MQSRGMGAASLPIGGGSLETSRDHQDCHVTACHHLARSPGGKSIHCLELTAFKHVKRK